MHCMWEPDMQCSGEAVRWGLGFGLLGMGLVAGVAIGALLHGIRLFMDGDTVLWVRG